MEVERGEGEKEAEAGDMEASTEDCKSDVDEDMVAVVVIRPSFPFPSLFREARLDGNTSEE